MKLERNEKNKRKILFSPPDISEQEIEEAAAALRSGWITTGPRVKELEERLAAFCHTDRVVCLSSATAAEELNLRVLGIGEGDEVIVPAYTYTASASAAVHVGAKVIFVDSQPDLGGIVCDNDRIFRAVENKKSLFCPGGNTEIGRKIQAKLGRVAVLSDAAHALGAQWHGRMAGAIADFTSFSFHAVKNFTTAEGGASTWKTLDGIDNEEIYHQYQLYSLHGQSKDALAKTENGSWEYDIVGAWYKCNMTDIMAAIGLRQLDRYPSLLARRKEIIQKYDAMCDSLGVKRLNHFGEDFSSSGHLYIVRVPFATDAQRREIITEMLECGISCNVHYKPLPMMTAYRNMGWDIKDFPNAYHLYENAVTLPLHTVFSKIKVHRMGTKNTRAGH